MMGGVDRAELNLSGNLVQQVACKVEALGLVEFIIH